MLTMKLEMEDGSVVPLTGIVKRLIKTQISSYKNGMGVELTSVPPEYDLFVQDLYRE